MTRLSDEQVATVAAAGSVAASMLAREVQEWRTLARGGPCPTCEGASHLATFDVDGRPVSLDCRECHGSGRTPGLIERLEAIRPAIPSSIYGMHPDPDAQLDAVIADLRRMVEP